jgi:hypothetical protein
LKLVDVTPIAVGFFGISVAVLIAFLLLQTMFYEARLTISHPFWGGAVGVEEEVANRSSSSTQRHAQLFGSGTTRRLREMAVAVVGCSGTGSPVIEQLARLGIGRLVLVDPDRVEEKNLNRILNATREDAYLKRPKVEVMARAIARMRFATEIEIIQDDLATPRVVTCVSLPNRSSSRAAASICQERRLGWLSTSARSLDSLAENMTIRSIQPHRLSSTSVRRPVLSPPG